MELINVFAKVKQKYLWNFAFDSNFRNLINWLLHNLIIHLHTTIVTNKGAMNKQKYVLTSWSYSYDKVEGQGELGGKEIKIHTYVTVIV